MHRRRLPTKRTLGSSFHPRPIDMSFVKAHYHPFLFLSMMLSGATELGLTAYLVDAGNENHTWPSARYHTLLLLILFDAAWTVLFSGAYMLWLADGARHFLANIASSIFWLSTNAILWGVSAGIFHHTRSGGICPNSPTLSRCRQTLTVEALAWTECALSIAALFFTCLWAGTRQKEVQDSRRMV